MFGAVRSSNLASNCTHSSNHMNIQTLCQHLFVDHGFGTDTLTRVLWTGHIMSNHEEDRSCSIEGWHYVIITPYGMVHETTKVNKSESEVRSWSIFVLMHELSHQLGAPDHYCYGKATDPSCDNPYCYYHVYGMAYPPNCIMSEHKNIEVLGNNLYCNDCYSTIFSHLRDHH